LELGIWKLVLFGRFIMGRDLILTKELLRAFLAAYGELGSVKAAARAVGVSKEAVYKRMDKDPDFKKEFQEVRRHQVRDMLESEAVRRGIKGVDEPRFFKGEECGSVRRYSDSLLVLLLKAVAPEDFRDHYVPPPPTNSLAEIRTIEVRLAPPDEHLLSKPHELPPGDNKPAGNEK
jgi:hypothetical protein